MSSYIMIDRLSEYKEARIRKSKIRLIKLVSCSESRRRQDAPDIIRSRSLNSNNLTSLLINDNLLLPKRGFDWVRISEDLIDLLQAAPLSLDKEEVNEHDARNIYKQVEEVELPACICHADRSGVGVDNCSISAFQVLDTEGSELTSNDVEPETIHSQTLGTRIVGENLAGVESLARCPHKCKGEEEDVDE